MPSSLDESANLGIPTWVYGFEPPNLFSTAIGKYFYNSLREDGLVSVANGGLIFGKGDAGTVQEIFQSTTLNYYRKPGIDSTPMVFYDVDFWYPSPENDASAKKPLDHNRKPVYPLIKKLAMDAEQPFINALELSDDADQIVKFISLANANKVASAPRAADLALAKTRTK